ncbi:MAG TPA: alcohol dehydrogenase catalytic domain-containing protein [Capsulimonadaceae bacterium]|jgi:L-iditol 2-dehydrogenase
MKTLYYPEFDRLEIANMPDPQAGAGDVVLEVAAVGLCGSELETFRNHSPRRKPPLVMGHEFCGTVVAVGGGVDESLLGGRFVSNSLVPCGECVRCKRGDTHLCAHRQIFGMHRPGAFAERCVVPARCLIPWPATLPAEAACLAEPLANGVHMVNLTRHLSPKTVLVIGAGPIGLMAQQAFQSMLGAVVDVADLSGERCAAAANVGARRVLDPRIDDVVAVGKEATEGEGYDLIVDAVGSPVTKRQSIDALRPGGAAVWIGLHGDELTVSSYDITLPERQVFGTYAATLDELRVAVDLMDTGKVRTADWVSVFSMADSINGFERMLAAKGADIKAVILPNQAEPGPLSRSNKGGG